MFMTLMVILGYFRISANKPELKGTRCLIKNVKYPNEYLLSSRHDYELFYDEFNTYYKRKIFTNRIDSNLVKTLKQIIWMMEPVTADSFDTFLITNNLFNDEHLCATHRHLEMFKLRRRIALISGDKSLLSQNDKCWWRFVPVQVNNITESNFYLIQNVHYNESLYAASYFFKSAITNARNVFTWHKQPDSTQFAWFLNCF
jgi:hypothetical protein